MAVSLHKTKCCAIEEIHGLQHTQSGEEAMVEFCKLELAGPVKFGTSSGVAGTLYSFYLFTSAIKHDGGDLYYGHYAQNFKKFIEDNKLGQVWESWRVKNEAFHYDHSNQVYIWTPDTPALKKWWADKLNPPKPEPVEVDPKCKCGADLDDNDLCSEGCDDEYEPEEPEGWDDEPYIEDDGPGPFFDEEDLFVPEGGH